MATGLHLNEDFTSDVLYNKSYGHNNWGFGGTDWEYFYLRAPAFKVNLTCSWGWWTDGMEVYFYYWDKNSWVRFHSIKMARSDNKWAYINTNNSGAKNVNSTIFKVSMIHEYSWTANFSLYGIGGMNQTQRDKIKGKSPVGCSSISPIYYTGDSPNDSGALSQAFMSETSMRGSCINDVASNDLHIQPPNMY